MDRKDLIFEKLVKLPNSKQDEVIDFIDFLGSKGDVQILDENTEWSEFSLSNAFQGTESEKDIYSLEDIKIKFKS